jgi:hypothetical protein
LSINSIDCAVPLSSSISNDEQLRDVGRGADIGGHSISPALKGRNFAIAEWPTASGPADWGGEWRIAYE